jgi:hypothetical protein
MQGFVPERSFTKDRRVINMRIDSVLMLRRPDFSATPTQSTASS